MRTIKLNELEEYIRWLSFENDPWIEVDLEKISFERGRVSFDRRFKNELTDAQFTIEVLRERIEELENENSDLVYEIEQLS